MPPTDSVFHLAIPCRDLEESCRFYVDQLGCRLARRCEDRVTIDFFSAQVVCHLAPDEIDAAARMYPRHFGITFCDERSFRVFHARAEAKGAVFFRPLFVRFGGRDDEHLSFFLQDPSNNLLEFKHYRDPAMMY